jgi:hypothetical protein
MTALPTRQELTITVKATIDGFPVDVCFSGSIDQLLGVTKRLREMGGTPTIAPAAPVQTTPARKAAERVEPDYQPDGTAYCPVHHKPLAEGRYGAFCSAKAKPGEEQNDKGYCSLRFAE